MGSRRIRSVTAMSWKRREGWLQRCSLSYDYACCRHLPSVECHAAPAFLFGSDLEPKLMPKEKNQIKEKSLHRHKIHSFTFSKSQIGPQLGSRETTPVSHLSMADQYCPRRNQHRAALFGINAGRPLLKSGGLVRFRRRRRKPFLLDHYRSDRNLAYLSSPLWMPSRLVVMRSERATRWPRTQSCSRSPNLEPYSTGGESHPVTSRVVPRADPKRCPPLTRDIVPS